MASPTEEQIRQNVRRLRDGDLSLDEFLGWFVPISWDIEKSKDPSLIDLTHELDGILAESSSAHWPEADVREEMAKAIRPFAKDTASTVPSIPFVHGYSQKVLAWTNAKLLSLCEVA